jgi:6-phosphogluconolactonase
MKNLILCIFLPFLLSSSPSSTNYMIVGTYTGGKSEGIYVYKFNSKDGTSTEVSHTTTSNPSYVTVSPNKKFVYAVSENANNGNGGEVYAYSFDKGTGTLTFVNKQFTGGDHPCYVDIDKTGKWLFTANYSSGTLSVLPVNADGSIGEATTRIEDHETTGPNKERQEKPHVHCTAISPDNHWLFVSDLGIDKVKIYAFDAATGKLTPATPPFVNAKAGAGPRHIAFHTNGKYAYLIEELTGTIEVFQLKNGKLTAIQQTSTIQPGQKGFAGSADIHLSADGKFLYGSNRGDFNNIAIYNVNPSNGKLSIIGFQPAQGKAPRNFNFDPSGNYLLVGNQDSDEIVVFKRNSKTGLLTDNKTPVSVGKPVCVKWIVE